MFSDLIRDRINTDGKSIYNLWKLSVHSDKPDWCYLFLF